MLFEEINLKLILLNTKIIVSFWGQKNDVLLLILFFIFLCNWLPFIAIFDIMNSQNYLFESVIESPQCPKAPLVRPKLWQGSPTTDVEDNLFPPFKEQISMSQESELSKSLGVVKSKKKVIDFLSHKILMLKKSSSVI